MFLIKKHTMMRYDYNVKIHHLDLGFFQPMGSHSFVKSMSPKNVSVTEPEDSMFGDDGDYEEDADQSNQAAYEENILREARAIADVKTSFDSKVNSKLSMLYLDKTRVDKLEDFVENFKTLLVESTPKRRGVILANFLYGKNFKYGNLDSASRTKAFMNDIPVILKTFSENRTTDVDLNLEAEEAESYLKFVSVKQTTPAILLGTVLDILKFIQRNYPTFKINVNGLSGKVVFSGAAFKNKVISDSLVFSAETFIVYMFGNKEEIAKTAPKKKFTRHVKKDDSEDEKDYDDGNEKYYGRDY